MWLARAGWRAVERGEVDWLSQGDVTGPLAGVRVVEFAQLIAGPFAGRILAEFGAEVIKVEPPGKGDQLRSWGQQHKGVPVWWIAQARNKKCVTLDLRKPEGQELARRLVAKSDMVIENFRPGTMEEWGLGPSELLAVNPGLVMVRISGFGQTGPYRDRPGFASICEAMGGLRHLTGFPDRPPVRVGVSLGDSLAALYAVIGGLLALFWRRTGAGGRGQVVDVSILESCFAMLESSLMDYDVLGIVRQRTGTALPGIVPTNTYRTADDRFVVIGGNTDSIFKRLMRAIGRPEVADDPGFATNQGRVQHREFIDGVIAEWTEAHPLDEVMRVLLEADVPVSPIYDIAQIASDEHYLARDMILRVPAPGLGEVRVPGVVPKLSETPGSVRWPGPALGSHNEEVYCGLLGLSRDELQELGARGVI